MKFPIILQTHQIHRNRTNLIIIECFSENSFEGILLKTQNAVKISSANVISSEEEYWTEKAREKRFKKNRFMNH